MKLLFFSSSALSVRAYKKYSLHSPFARQVLALGLSILLLAIAERIILLAPASTTCNSWLACKASLPLEGIQYLPYLLTGITSILVILTLFEAWQAQREHIVILPLTTIIAILFFGKIFTDVLLGTGKHFYHLVILHDLTVISLWIGLVLLIFISGMPTSKYENNIHLLQNTRRLSDFLILTKPWIVALLLVTTIAGLIAGYRALPPFSLTFWTELGGALAAGGSSALNQYIDRELDKHMQRTANRPLAAARLTDAEGLAFGLALCLLSYYILAGLVNFLAAILALIGIIYYVVFYSLWLKKATVQNIVIGGGAGAIPPLVGWAAATGNISALPVILFLIIFMWTPPHYWALAIVRRKDYEKAQIPMLPVVRGEKETRRQILLYAILLVTITLLPAILHLAGNFYLASALILGIGLLYAAWSVWKVPGNKVAFRMYRWSSYYLLFIFMALMIDALIA